MRAVAAFALALALPFAAAQTVTITNAAGQLVVEDLTLNPLGVPTTVTLQTLGAAGGAAGVAFTSTVTTTNAAAQTVVEQIIADGLGDTQTNILETVPAAPNAAAFTSTITTTDAAAETVIEQIIADGLGDTQTNILQTVTPAAAGGPVGAPAPTTGAAGAPTEYTYTTEINGITTAVVATFTPSFATTIVPSATFQATVLNYSQYLASYATQTPTQAADTSKNNAAVPRTPAGWWGAGFSVLTSVIGGAIFVLA